VLSVISGASFNLATLDQVERCTPPIRRRPTETTRQLIERAMRENHGYTVAARTAHFCGAALTFGVGAVFVVCDGSGGVYIEIAYVGASVCTTIEPKSGSNPPVIVGSPISCGGFPACNRNAATLPGPSVLKFATYSEFPCATIASAPLPPVETGSPSGTRCPSGVIAKLVTEPGNVPSL
jgi:hypothetical protein